MKDAEFSFGDAMIPKQRILETTKRLRPEIRDMANAISKGYEDDLASLYLPDDTLMLGKVRQIIGENLQLKPVYLVVVGIGGSNLGTIAVQEAILGKLYNQLTASTKVLYADTVDSDGISNIITLVKPALEKGGNIVLDVISKSGTTTETIANAEVLIDLLRRQRKITKIVLVLLQIKTQNCGTLPPEKDSMF